MFHEFNHSVFLTKTWVKHAKFTKLYLFLTPCARLTAHCSLCHRLGTTESLGPRRLVTLISDLE